MLLGVKNEKIWNHLISLLFSLPHTYSKNVDSTVSSQRCSEIFVACPFPALCWRNVDGKKGLHGFVLGSTVGCSW